MSVSTWLLLSVICLNFCNDLVISAAISGENSTERPNEDPAANKVTSDDVTTKSSNISFPTTTSPPAPSTTSLPTSSTGNGSSTSSSSTTSSSTSSSTSTSSLSTSSSTLGQESTTSTSTTSSLSTTSSGSSTTSSSTSSTGSTSSSTSSSTTTASSSSTTTGSSTSTTSTSSSSSTISSSTTTGSTSSTSSSSTTTGSTSSTSSSSTTTGSTSSTSSSSTTTGSTSSTSSSSTTTGSASSTGSRSTLSTTYPTSTSLSSSVTPTEKLDTCASVGKIPCLGYPEICIPETWLCDFGDDCPHGTDEANCDGEPGSEVNGGNSEFGGGNVIIVDPALPTDRPFEPNCRWQGGMACPSEAGLCVPGNRICDGIFDCPDGEDETGLSCLHKQMANVEKGVAKLGVKVAVFLLQTKEAVSVSLKSIYCKIFSAKTCTFNM